jgi:DNA-binding NarL/FixJ family response regulator
MARILIADDNEAMRGSLRSLLSGEGWSVCGEAADGGQAVEMAGRLAPDLIILDLAMPVLDGLRAAFEILKTDPSRPILLYTLHNSEVIEVEAKKAGVRGVISKTADLGALLECVQSLLAGTPERVAAAPRGAADAQLGVRETDLERPAEPA